MTSQIHKFFSGNAGRGYIDDGKRHPGSATLCKIKQVLFLASSKKSKNIFAATWNGVFPHLCGGEAERTSVEKTKQED